MTRHEYETAYKPGLAVLTESLRTTANSVIEVADSLSTEVASLEARHEQLRQLRNDLKTSVPHDMNYYVLADIIETAMRTFGDLGRELEGAKRRLKEVDARADKVSFSFSR